MRVGDEAPDVELPLHTGESIRLFQYRGRRNVVLYFYPKDFTSGCTREGCLFTSHLQEIIRLDSVIIGVSADSLDSHKAFAQQYALGFPLASDVQKHVCRKFGALWLGGIAIRRLTFVIDKVGIIRGKIHHELSIDRHWVDVLNILRGLEGKGLGTLERRMEQ